jgi:hypothetical protein
VNKRIEQLKWLLVDAIYDLATPAALLREYQSNKDNDLGSAKYFGVCRMCNSHTIIALAKLDEAINHFGNEIKDFPPDLRNEIRQIKREIETRGVYAFRSKYVAHSFSGDGSDKAPLKIDDGYRMLEKVTGPNLDEFYNWVSPEGNESENDRGVVAVVVKMRDHCGKIVGMGTARP